MEGKDPFVLHGQCHGKVKRYGHCFESTSRLRALFCRLWQVPFLVIGPLQSMYPAGHPPELPGEYTAAHTQLGATAYKSALTGTHLLLGREKQCSVKCLAQGHSERRTGRVLNSGLDLDPNPKSCTLPLDQFVATWLLYPPYPKDRGMLWFYVEAARRPPPATRRPPPAMVLTR